jgi:hypothetical protein
MKAIKLNGQTIHLPVSVAYHGANGVAVVDAHGHVVQMFANQASPTALIDDAPHYIAAAELAAKINA